MSEGVAADTAEAASVVESLQLEAIGVSGEPMATLEVEANWTVAHVCHELAHLLPPNCQAKLVSLCGRELIDSEEVGPLAESGQITVQVAVIKVPPRFLTWSGGSTSRANPSTIIYRSPSGRAVLPGLIKPGTGVHEARIQVSVPPPTHRAYYLSLGVIDAERALSTVGPGYQDGEVAWLLRDGVLGVLTSCEREAATDLPRIEDGDFLRMEFDTDSRELEFVNETCEASFRRPVPGSGPWHFAAGGYYQGFGRGVHITLCEAAGQ